MAVRITDSSGDLVAEFSGSDAAAEKVITFWRENLADEELTVRRGEFSAQPPKQWSAKAAEIYKQELQPEAE